MARALVTAGLALALGLLPAASAAGAPGLRTVVVTRDAKRLATPQVAKTNGHGGRSYVSLVKGQLPRPGTVAVVLTDQNCQADAYGISHCLNDLRLPGGRQITVIHSHDMHHYPCLTPGERVRLQLR